VVDTNSSGTTAPGLDQPTGDDTDNPTDTSSGLTVRSCLLAWAHFLSQGCPIRGTYRSDLAPVSQQSEPSPFAWDTGANTREMYADCVVEEDSREFVNVPFPCADPAEELSVRIRAHQEISLSAVKAFLWILDDSQHSSRGTVDNCDGSGREDDKVE